MSTNEQFAPNEDNLTMVQRPSTITILYMIIGANTLVEQLKWFHMFQVFVQFASKQTELLQDEVEQNISIKQKILKKLKPSSV